MKTTFHILIVNLFFYTSLFAQDCDFETKKNDKFTGKTEVSNSFSLGGHLFYLRKLDTIHSIEFVSMSFKGALQQGIEKGTVGQFRLANGEFASFTASQAAEPVVKVNGTSTDVYSTFRVNYNITPAELAKISKSPPVAFNIPLGSVSAANDIPEKKGVKMQETAKCLLEFKN